MNDKEIKSLNRSLGARMKMLRMSHHMTQDDIAQKSGYSKNYISAVERGVNKISAAMVLDYCRILSITPDDFFGYDSETASINRDLLELIKTMDAEQQQKLVQLIKLTGF